MIKVDWTIDDNFFGLFFNGITCVAMIVIYYWLCIDLMKNIGLIPIIDKILKIWNSNSI